MKTVIFIIFACVFMVQAAFAFDFSGNITAPKQQKAFFRYSGLYQPQRRFSGVSGKTSLHRESLAASIPLYRGEKDGLVFNANAQLFDPVPDQAEVGDFYDLQGGLSYTRVLGDRRMLMVSGLFGSASDKPFKDSSVYTFGGTAMYAFPGGETSSWLLLLNYSNNRPILNGLPLPGFAYLYFPSKTFRGTFGVPFASIWWEFIPKWSLTLFTVAPWVLKGQVAYSLFGPAQVYSGLDFSQVTFFKYDRVDSKERIFYDEKKAFLGIRLPITRFLLAEFETGYSFGRQIFSARRFSTRPASVLELGASAYGRLGLTAFF